MNYSQKWAVTSIFFLLLVLTFHAFLIYWFGFDRFARNSLASVNAVFVPLYLFMYLRLPFMRRICLIRPEDTYDEYDRWVAYRAIMAAFIAFWVYTIALCVAVVIHWHQQPYAQVPVFYLTLVLLGGAFLLALVHAASVLFLYWHEARAVNGDRKT